MGDDHSIVVLKRSDLPADTESLAGFLIGKSLVRETAEGRVSGRIVEAEAYPPGDAAGHAFRGLTQSNHSLFLEHGHGYVYFAYGSSYMMNVSAEREGIGAGVLLRAIEPLEGIPLMERRRNTEKLVDLCRGPGRLTQSFGIDRSLDGLDLCKGGPLWLGSAAGPTGVMEKSVRIGITREKERLLRFYESGNPFVSGPSRLRG
jgi:DNA-3-methyladenine glycosylase